MQLIYSKSFHAPDFNRETNDHEEDLGFYGYMGMTYCPLLSLVKRETRNTECEARKEGHLLDLHLKVGSQKSNTNGGVKKSFLILLLGTCKPEIVILSGIVNVFRIERIWDYTCSMAKGV